MLDALDEGWKVARPWIERAIRLSLSRPGTVAAARFGIDSFGTIPKSHANLPPRFLTERYPRVESRLETQLSRYRGRPNFIDGR